MRRTWALIVITILSCCGLYYLPKQVMGYQLKKIDLFSDLHKKAPKLNMDSIVKLMEAMDTLTSDTIAIPPSIEEVKVDTLLMHQRDSLFNELHTTNGADSTGNHIEDYTFGHVGLKRFLTALSQAKQRAVHIAVMGDSFIEGDIFVADLRSSLQQLVGGKGVGYLPITSVADPFRASVNYSGTGWNTHKIGIDSLYRFTIPGFVYTADTIAEIHTLDIKMTRRYKTMRSVSQVQILYQKNLDSKVKISINGEPEEEITLPKTNQLRAFSINHDSIRTASIAFTQTDSLTLLGTTWDGQKGISVDNFSVRGCSGMPFVGTNHQEDMKLNELRPYDLIILQYGLNIVTDDQLDYNWYRYHMKRMVRHLQNSYPSADILIMGVSDRCHLENGEFKTMPAILSMLYTQRKMAQELKINFWNTYGAMGGENSMVKFVEKNWASKDYTHLSSAGGRELARDFLKALMNEKKLYDQTASKLQ
ncbi:MAG: hypothetical protein WCR36_00795 [Bacteroidaceae bacterium]